MCTHRDNISVYWAHLHHISMVWLVPPYGGIVIDVQDSDVHLNKVRSRGEW